MLTQDALDRVKIGSGDTNNPQLLSTVGKLFGGPQGCQIILSTGMSSMREVAQAVLQLEISAGRPAVGKRRRSLKSSWTG